MSRIVKNIFFFVLLGGFVAGGFRAAPAAESARAPGALISSARVPFVANEGQVANPEVKYYARTFGGTVYALADGRIVYSLPKYESGKTAGAAVITEILRGAFRDPPVGAGKSPVTVSSFIGNKPEKWKANLPAFDRLDFGEVYEGVSLLLSARGNNVEKIFVLSPGADPREIAFRFEGASDIAIMPDGQLELQTALGAIYFTRPVAWQIEEAECLVGAPLAESAPKTGARRARPLQHTLVPVEVAYALDEDGTVRFELGPYDQNNILVIDPLLASTFIGGGGADAVQAMAVDSQTNIYVAGWTDSSDFPTTNSPYSSTPAGGRDAFVSKFDANLGTLSASTYIGGSSNDQATAIGIDAGSRIWLVGYTESTNFPAPSSPMDTSYNGNGDAFVAIFTDTTLSALVRATYLGGSGVDYAAAIAMDNTSYRQYIVGYTESANFPVTNSTGYKTNYNGARDAFTVVFSNNVDRAGYKTGIFLGGTNADEAAGVVLTPGTASTNFVFVVGSTASTNFPATNAYQRLYGGGSNDAFISRLSVLLTNLPASTFLGGIGSDAACAVGLDLNNRAYVAGWTTSTNFPQNPTNNVFYPGWTNAYQGGQDIFVSCLIMINNLTNLYASTYIGGAGDDVAKCLVMDTNTPCLSGYTSSSNFPVTRAAYDRSYNGGEDAFVLRFDGPLTNLYASTYLGGAGNDRALALALSPDSNTLFVAGITASSNDFPSSDAAYQNVFVGGASDGFVTRFPASLAYGTEKWRKSLAPGVCSSPALVWDGTITLGNSTSLFAFTRSGDARWQASTTSAVTRQSEPSGYGAPAVWTNNVIYINTGSGKAYAITDAGAVSLLFSGVAGPTWWSAPALDNNGRLYFSQNQYLYSIKSGANSWTNNLTNDCYSSPSVSSNGTIYAVVSPPPTNILYAFNTNGSTSNIWRMLGTAYSSPALDTNGTIYAASSSNLYAFSPDGLTTQKWANANAAQIYSSPAIGSNGVVYIGGGNNLYAYSPTSAAPVKTWTAGGTVQSSPAISADGSIIIGATNGVYSFNPDGTTNWFFETYSDIRLQSPLIDSEGTIYISDRGYLYALYGPAPPAESAWPMYRRDALRTGNQGLNIPAFLKPAGLTAAGSPDNYIRVSWSASANALNYELWRSTSNSTAGATRLRRLTQTNYNDSAVELGQTYYYWVKVKTPVALSAFSDYVPGGLPPLPPENVTATKGVPTNYVVVTWQASSNATGYKIYRNRDNTNTPAYLASTAETNYSDYSIEPSFRYYYWITATNSLGSESGLSSNDYGGTPCWPPTGLSAAKGAAVHSVALSWAAPTGASAYVVYRHTDTNSSAAVILNTVTNVAMTDSSGTPLRAYYYWARATNEFGLSGFSDPDYGWSLLAAPHSVLANSEILPNTIRVSWIAGSTDATAHAVFRSESSDSAAAVWQADVVYNNSTATNYGDTAVTRGPAYYYWVAAKNSYGSSSWSAASSPGAGLPPTAPTDLSATDGVYSNMVKVTWTPSSGVIYYWVYRNESSDPSSAAPLGSAFASSYEDRGAINGVLYYYWVRAANSYGLSFISAFNSGWRGMLPPDSITAGDGASTSEVSVTWSPASGATAYELWRGTSSNAASASRLANNIAAVSYSDRVATPGTIYYYWVKSKNGTHESAFSANDSGYRAVGMVDIAVADFVFLPAVQGPLAHPSAVSFKVSNLSAIDMIAPNNALRYDFYLATNLVFGVGTNYWFGGTNSTLSLSAGASTRVALSQKMREIIAVPVWATGSYYVFVFVNHCLPSVWLDPSLANNAARRFGDSILVTSATALQPVWNDYDGDGKTDLAVYLPAVPSAQPMQAGQAGGEWRVWLSGSGYARVDLSGLGGAGYRAVPRDYDGDGKFDPAVYKDGVWQVCLSAYDYQVAVAAGWGGAGQSAAPVDYDGDSRADPAIYQEASGKWRAWLSALNYAEVHAPGMGGAGWQPVPADYDGDGRADPAVYQAGGWRFWLSGDSYHESAVAGWGGAGQTAVPADYDGDGRVDPAVYYETSGGWRFWLSSSSYREINVAGWGGSGQTAVPGDYDSDGKVDPVVFWESMGLWRFWLSGYRYFEINLLEPGGIGFHAITAEER